MDAIPNLFLVLTRFGTLSRLLWHARCHQSPSFEMAGGSGNAIRSYLVVFLLFLIQPLAHFGGSVVAVPLPGAPAVLVMLRHGDGGDSRVDDVKTRRQAQPQTRNRLVAIQFDSEVEIKLSCRWNDLSSGRQSLRRPSPEAEQDASQRPRRESAMKRGLYELGV